MSLLTIIQRSARAMSLTVPGVVTTSTDPQVLQLWELANEEGESLARDFDWQALRREQLVVASATPDQPGWLPADFDRFVAETGFDRAARRPLNGPVSPRQWQALQAQPAAGGGALNWYERGGQVLVSPTPSAGESLAFEYVSRNWALSAAMAPQDAFLADTDSSLLDERLIRLGLRWRFLSAKGLDYGEALRTCEIEKQKAKARDGGNRILSAVGRDGVGQGANLPEGDFG